MHTRHLFYHWVYPFILVSIALEILYFLVIQHRSYPFREMFASVGISILRLPMRLLRPLVVAPVAYFLWVHRVATVPLDNSWGLLLLFLGTEFTYYWMHRASHEIRWLWASHVVHHTPEHIHLASAFRLGATEVFSGGWLFHVSLYWLGFSPLAVSAMLGVNLFFQFWLHTDLIGRLGPLEWVFNTPSHHRVHHASNGVYLDRNYGGILIVWDRLFGTFAREEPGTPLTYGLVHPIGSLNPLKILFHEWIAMGRDFSRARTVRERLRQLFGRPADGLACSLSASTRRAVALEAD
jgi:sterol desaturase/sphingolipid hydroxylase (fatty acid hydroxylase superfamily)